jgi:uncharacterized membrane protein HdeD (DUF308 family)
MNELNVLAIDVPRELGRNWGWFLALGMGLSVLGVFCIVYAATATVASMYFFGGVLLAAAAIECVNAVMVGKWSGFFLHLLGVLLFGVTGFLLLKHPLISAESLTVLMAAFFLVGGMFEIIAPLVMSLPETGWHVLNGAVAVLLGILLLVQWPISGLWAIGLFVGVDLLFRGITWTVFAFGLRSLAHGTASLTTPSFGHF